MSISKSERMILTLLAISETGVEYANDMVEASAGILGTGTIYLRLMTLVERGLVKRRLENPRHWLGKPLLPRSLYSITEEGKHALEACVRGVVKT